MKPQPKLRPRVCKGRAYTPTKTINAEAELRFLALQSVGPGFTMIDTPITLGLQFIMLKPKSAKKRTHHCVRPDIDNLIKLVADGLNGVLWKDDALIWKVVAEKLYSPEFEFIDITIVY